VDGRFREFLQIVTADVASCRLDSVTFRSVTGKGMLLAPQIPDCGEECIPARSNILSVGIPCPNGNPIIVFNRFN
jgi:hypothetical protein